MTAVLTILACFAVAGLAAWPLHRAANRWQPQTAPALTKVTDLRRRQLERIVDERGVL